VDAAAHAAVAKADVIALLVGPDLFDVKSFPLSIALVDRAVARRSEGARVLTCLARSCLWNDTALAGSAIVDARAKNVETAASIVVEAITAALRRCPVPAEALDRYLETLEAHHGSILLAGLTRDRAAGAIDVHEVFVSVDATRSARPAP